MPPVTAATGAAAGKVGATGGAAKIGKNAEDAKKASSSGGKGKSVLPKIDNQNKAAANLRGLEEKNTEDNTGEEENENPVNYTGSGQDQSLTGQNNSKQKGKLKKALPVILAPLAIFLIPLLLIFGSGSLLFADIDENTMASMDVQYVAMREVAHKAAGVALANGSLPSPLADRLTEAGLEVGYLDNDGTFIAGLRPNSNTTIASTTVSDSTALNTPSSTSSSSSSEQDNSLVIRFKGTIITAANWDSYFENPEVYKAFKEATYGRAAGHYDDAAELFYSNINASRNVFAAYTSSSDKTDFREILSDYNKNNQADSAYIVKDKDCDDGKANQCDSSKDGHSSAVDAYLDELYQNTLIEPDDCDWDPNGFLCEVAASFGLYDSSIHGVYDKAQAATLAYLVNSAVNANETYESMKYFLMLEEIMSKTKAGDGAKAPINEMLNYLTTPDKNGVSAVQSPTLSSVLTKSFGNYNSENETAPFSLDRIQSITEKYLPNVNKAYFRTALATTGLNWSKSGQSTYAIRDDSLSMIKLLEDDPPDCDKTDLDDKKCQEKWEKYEQKRSPEKHPVTMSLIDELKEALSPVEDSQSQTAFSTSGITFGNNAYAAENNVESNTTFLSDTGFNSIIGAHSGELFSKGGSILGAKIATTAQGGTIGTTDSVATYQKETDRVLALEAAADRLDRSPFDITSQNSFLGNILHSFSNYLYTSSSASNAFSSFSSLLRNSFTDILPGAFADSQSSFQTTYGECPESETYGEEFVCSTFSFPTVTFDIDYIKSQIESADFSNFLSQNVDSNGKPLAGSVLEEYINYNNNRTSNAGYVNTKIADELVSKGRGNLSRQFLTFIENKFTQFKSEENRLLDYFSTYYARFSDEDLEIIAGNAYVNNGSSSWTTNYQKAQLYCVLARFLDQAGYFSEENTNETAFNDYFTPGTGENPYVIALKESSTDFSTLNDAEYLAAISGMSEKEANVVLGYFAYESYLASIDYENRLAFGKEETFDLESSIQFEETNPYEAELAVLLEKDHLKITRKDPTYAA